MDVHCIVQLKGRVNKYEYTREPILTDLCSVTLGRGLEQTFGCLEGKQHDIK